MRVTCLKTAIHVPETHLEARVSQNFYIGLRLNLIACRSGEFQKIQRITKISQKLPVFCSTIKTYTEIKILRHPSLDGDVFYIY